MRIIMNQCLLWKIPADVQHSEDSQIINSPRAGGLYRATGTVITLWESYDDTHRANVRPKLTSWIVDQHRSGVEEPIIDPSVLERVKERRVFRYSERVERFFQMLIDQDYKISDHIRIAGVVDNKTTATKNRLAAWIGAENEKEPGAFLCLLGNAGLLEASENGKWTLTAAGFERLEQTDIGGANSKQVFVAMWFAKEMDAIYAEGIAPAIKEVGYQPFRIDRKEHNNKIDDEIISEIRRSRFMIADFTCGTFKVEEKARAEARGGVYYEAGFAQGLNMPLIWTVREDCIDHVHFDTRQFAHIVWADAADLKAKLINRIRASIR